ncbi:MAG: D-alanyl-D-alanine carboxypeptidase [Chloroflexota bacterium]|nr:MAG: D-alanyl-D-alanine carboxypeptidase [Chloroflexota bacterium]
MSRSCLLSLSLAVITKVRSRSVVLVGLLSLAVVLGILVYPSASVDSPLSSRLALPGAEAAGLQAAAAPSITGRSAVVLDGSTGQVLLDRQGDVRLAPASLTKIMTTLIAVERGRLSDVVKVSVDGAELARTTGSSIMGLTPGEEIRLEDLLYGMMLPSGNDAALAVAEHVSGSVDAFVMLMNRRAIELGLKNTNFANPHGLDATGHYSSARDMAVLSRYAMSNPTFARIAGARSYAAQGQLRSYSLWNLNRLIGQYPGADGVKIGYTDDAGQTIVGSATKNGRRLFVSVMGCTNMFGDATALLDYYFRSLPPGPADPTVTSTSSPSPVRLSPTPVVPSVTPIPPTVVLPSATPIPPTPIPPSATPVPPTATPSPSPGSVWPSPSSVPPSATSISPTASPSPTESTPTQHPATVDGESVSPTGTPLPTTSPTPSAVESSSPPLAATEAISPWPPTETPVVVVRRAENAAQAQGDTGVLGLFVRAWDAIGSLLGRLMGRGG